MAEKIGSIDMKHVERAKAERRFLYVDWKTGSVMISNVSNGGGKKLSDEVIKERKALNETISGKRKTMRKEISELNKDIVAYAKKGDFKSAEKASNKAKEIEKELKSKDLKKKTIPARAKK